MRKTIFLESGHEIDLHWDDLGRGSDLVSIELWRGKMKLGMLVLSERGRYEMPNYREWFRSEKDEDEAAAYYEERYPDLGAKERGMLFRKGFDREVNIQQVIERAREVARAVAQPGRKLYLAIDRDGRIAAWGESARSAIGYAGHAGWKGWYSPDRADGDTLAIVPADRVHVSF
jgi:hypothetical protein